MKNISFTTQRLNRQIIGMESFARRGYAPPHLTVPNSSSHVLESTESKAQTYAGNEDAFGLGYLRLCARYKVCIH